MIAKCICRGRGYYDRWSIWMGVGLGTDGCGWHQDDNDPVVGRDSKGVTIDVAPADSPYWVPGSPVDLPHDSDARFVERAPCLGCEDRRQAYADRREAKLDRREARVDSLRASSNAGIKRSGEMLPWGGQPILVGHHSEKRHRRDQERSHSLMRKSIDEGREAQRLANISPSTGISSDDPDAIQQLREKLAGLELRRGKIHEANRARRRLGLDRDPPYVLVNLGATIRSVTKRIADLERAAAATIPADVEVGAVRVHWDVGANRVQVFSPKPAPSERKANSAKFKRSGFKWSPSNECWQRMASASAWHLALEFAA